MSFETHITLDTSYLHPASVIFLENEYNDMGWKTSKIIGDPVLGPGSKFYFTRHDLNYNNAHTSMLELCDTLKNDGFKPVRRKIEQILLDERF